MSLLQSELDHATDVEEGATHLEAIHSQDDSNYGTTPEEFSNAESKAKLAKDVEIPHEISATRSRPKSTYKDLLNSVIATAAGVDPDDREVFSPSYVGASYWCSDEKQRYFRAVAKYGRNELRDIAQDIGTKTESEVIAYSSLLKRLSPRTIDLSDRADLADIPAAFEINEHCEEILNDAANHLALRVNNRDFAIERTRYEDFWLINEPTAARIGSHVNSGDALDEMQRVPEPYNDHSVDDLIVPRTDDTPGPEILAASLLDAETFLRLSRHIFMNSAQDPESNWRNIGTFDEASSSPAMFHSAFEDFYALTLVFTRQLVQASLLQATSRLRANDGYVESVAEVTVRDIRTAQDIAGAKSDKKEYWATVARRCGIDVLHDSQKLRDTGRAGTKYGFKLTFDEVETELGYPPDDGAKGLYAVNAEDANLIDHSDDSDTTAFDSLAFDHDDRKWYDSIEPDHNRQAMKRSDTHTSLDDDRLGEGGASASNSESETDDELLERLDLQESLSEVQRLYDMLGRRSPTKANAEEALSIARGRRRLSSMLDEEYDWRKRVKYEAEWEHCAKRPDSGGV